jgi:hypothetical protein
MLQTSVEKILGMLKPDNLVLDVGGWACPFNRAQYILDAEPYETRGWYKVYGGPASQGGDKEWFTKETWVQRDICEHTPWPFRDKQFDFAICSGTLEDIRDPLWVCSELIRVAKRGYIEVPTRQWESSRGIEYPNLAGMSHHRWLVEIEGNQIQFLQKYHAINAHWRFSFPRSYGRTLVGERAMQCLWWEGSFDFVETSINGTGNTEQILAEYVQRIHPYPRWLLAVDRYARRALSLPRRVVRKLRAKANYAKYGFADPT